MGRNKHCSQEVRLIIKKLRNKGYSYRNISKTIGCSLGMIQNALKYKMKEETRGRPRKTTEEMERRIVREVKKNPFISSSQIQAEIELNISQRTIRRRLVEHNFKSFSPRKVPLLKTRHLKERLKFAKDHIEWDGDNGIKKWNNILFSDESKFMLFGNDGKSHVRRPPNQAFNPNYTKKTVKHGGGKILVWGCFSWFGVGPLFLINDIMTKDVYINILNSVMLPYAEWNMPLIWTFQQDNDPKHTARDTTAWFRENNVKVMSWPAQSPDLSPIENLWKQVKDKLKDAKPRNKAELWASVRDAWYSIPVENCQRLIESMPKRCRSVLLNKGHAINY